MNEPRYFVDERVGCIAVRDRDNTDHHCRGLHEETNGVVWYRHGELVPGPRCPTCGRQGTPTIHVDSAYVTEAQTECARLNANEAGRKAEQT